MTKQEIFDFITKNPICALATIEGNQPRVRMILTYRADENGIVFVTGENKDLYKQLSNEPNIEMCFYSSKPNKEIRVTGVAEELEDIELKKQIVRDWPFLKEWVDRDGYDVLVLYCVRKGKATMWSMDINFKPKEYIQL